MLVIYQYKQIRKLVYSLVPSIIYISFLRITYDLRIQVQVLDLCTGI